MKDLETLSAIANNIVTTLAIACGGIWAWLRFRRTRENVWNLQISIDHAVHRYTATLHLLTLYVGLANIGKINISPGLKGCEVSLVRIPTGLATTEVIEWDDCEVILDKYDCIWNRGSDQDRKPFYSIEPGCTYTEALNIPVEPGTTMMAQVRFWWKDDDDCITEQKTITSSLEYS